MKNKGAQRVIQAAVQRKTGEFPRHSTSTKGDRMAVCGGHVLDLLQAQGVQGVRADLTDQEEDRLITLPVVEAHLTDKEVEDHLSTLRVVEAHLTDQEVEARPTILPVVEVRHTTLPAEGVEGHPPTSLRQTRIRHQTRGIVSDQPLLPAR